MIPAEFSIRGPHNTLPWVGIISGDNAQPEPMLLWADSREEAESMIQAWYPRETISVRLFQAQNPSHHLGNARVVQLSEL